MTAPEDDPGRSARFAQILSRLLELPHYVWDTEIEPFHSVSTPKPQAAARR